MSAITAKASRKMKKYAVLTREPRCFLGSFDFSWEQRKVSDLAEKTYGGGTPTTSNEAYWNGDIPWIQSSDVVDGKLLGVEPRKWITQDGLNNSAAQLIPGNSIAIITRVGVGKLAFMPYSYATSQDFLSLSKLNAEPLFTVYACYKKLQSELNAVQGTSIKGITKDELLAKNIMVPRYAEQQQIGAFFKQLDNLITLHQRKCANLCSPSQVVFSLLFVTSTFSWEQRKLGDISEIKTGPFGSTLHADDYVSDGTPIITTEHFKTGALPRSKNGLPQVSDSDYKRLTAYTLDDGDIVFSRVGSVDINALITPFQSNWLFSGRVLRVRPQTDISSKFLHTRLETESIKTDIRTRAVGQTMPSINTEILKITPLVLPSSAAEQEQIGSYFAALDNLITLHQRECISFTGRADRLILTANKKRTTSSWEQRKFSELVQIERGGSPRPIDDFITDAPNGLNWVKIGDAPTQGNYITKTAEKIRPEGLSKTREVHPGDLILSNSMSFGKPYIMGIDGCIHDGWLLIRNTYGVFDLTFLCHLLGTPQMLSQYRSLAAGSTVNNLNKELVGNTVVTIPSITEQRVLGDYLEQLDNLITLHQRKPFLMKWRTSDANRNQTNRLVL